MKATHAFHSWLLSNKTLYLTFYARHYPLSGFNGILINDALETDRHWQWAKTCHYFIASNICYLHESKVWLGVQHPTAAAAVTEYISMNRTPHRIGKGSKGADRKAADSDLIGRPIFVCLATAWNELSVIQMMVNQRMRGASWNKRRWRKRWTTWGDGSQKGKLWCIQKSGRWVAWVLMYCCCSCCCRQGRHQWIGWR